MISPATERVRKGFFSTLELECGFRTKVLKLEVKLLSLEVGSVS